MTRALPAVLVALSTAVLAASPATAHDGVVHVTSEAARAHAGPPPARLAGDLPAELPDALPFALGGPFRLTDQTGAERTETDPEGRMQLLFFGYANCPSICAVALPMMAEVVDALGEQGVPARPVMITVDPERDTPETMGTPLSAIHPDLIGLTGDEAALAQARAAFGVGRSLVGELPDTGPIYAHGSHVFLLDGAGAVLTILPPVLTVERMTEIALRYARGGAG